MLYQLRGKIHALICATALSACLACWAQADDVLRFRATSQAAGGRMYCYWKSCSASRTIQAGDYVEYDVYINNNVAGLGGIEIVNTDGWSWRALPGWADQNGLGGHPGADIAPRAYHKWYHRKLAVPAGAVGKTISRWDLAVDGTYGPDACISAQYDNIKITNGGVTVLNVYQNGAPLYNTEDFSYGRASANLLYGPTRTPAKQLGALLFPWFDAPDPSYATDIINDPRGLGGDPYDGYGAGYPGGGYYSSLNEYWWEGVFSDMKRAGLDFVEIQHCPGHGSRLYIPDNTDQILAALERSGCDLKLAMFGGNSAVAIWNNENGRGWNVDPPLDLSRPDIVTYFYDKDIKSFFAAIPKKYWATHNGLSLEQGGRPIVITYATSGYSSFDLGTYGNNIWISVKQRFAADFKDANGNGIVPFLVLESSWFVNGAGAYADGRYGWAAAVYGPNTYGVGGYYTTQIGPGYDDRLIRNPGGYTPRQDGGQMVRWFNSRPAGRNIFDSNLILVETWNELAEGSGIERSLDYPADAGGYLPETHYIDTFRNLAASSVGFRDYDATFLRTWQIPEIIFRGEPVSVPVRNDGFLPWDPGSSALGGRLLNAATGSVISGTERSLADMPQSLLQGQECLISFTVPADWPTGYYVLQLDMKHGPTWFASDGDSPVTKPVWVAATSQPCSVGQARNAGPGWAGIVSGIVTAVFRDYGRFVIEAEDRSSGLSVTPIRPVGLQVGQEVRVAGGILSDGRLQAVADAVQTGRTVTIDPVGVANKSITGVVGNPGLANTDMLVSAWGRVIDEPVAASDFSRRFHITDGSASGGPTVGLPGGCGRVLEDNFDGGLHLDWHDWGSPTMAQDDVLVGGPGTRTTLPGVIGLDTKAAVDASSSAEAGIMLRFRDPGNFLLAIFANGGIYFHEVVNSNYGGMLNMLQTRGLGPDIHLAAQVQGSTATLSVTDGTVSYTTSLTLNSITWHGSVGLFLNGSQTQYFDNFRAFTRLYSTFFEDNFDAGKNPAWHDYGALTTASAGRLTAPHGTITPVTGTNEQNPMVKVDALKSCGEAGIILRFVDPGNFLLAMYSPAHQAMWFHEVVGGNYGGTVNWMPVPSIGENLHLIASVDGPYLVFSISDGTSTYLTTRTVTTVLWAGAVGLFHNNNPSQRFDNFQALRVADCPSDVSGDAVQVGIPPSLMGILPVSVGDYVKVVGIAGKGTATGGNIRAVTIRESAGLEKIAE